MTSPPDPLHLPPDAPLPQPPGRRARRLTLVMLGAWFLASFGFAFFARELEFDFFGWPFSFWMAAQGAPILYVLITALYAALANRQEREESPAEPD